MNYFFSPEPRSLSTLFIAFPLPKPIPASSCLMTSRHSWLSAHQESSTMLGRLLTGHVAVFGLLGSCFHFSGASGSEATSVVFTAKEDIKGKQEDSGSAIGHRIPTTPASSHPSSLPACCPLPFCLLLQPEGGQGAHPEACLQRRDWAMRRWAACWFVWNG